MIFNTLLLINSILFINSSNVKTSKNIKPKAVVIETNKNISNKAIESLNEDKIFESSLEENWDKVNPLKILTEKPTTMFPITKTLRKKPNKKYRIVPPVPKNNRRTSKSSTTYQTNPITLFPVARTYVNSPLYFLWYPAGQNSPPALQYSLPGYHLAPLPKELVPVSAERDETYIRDLDSLTTFEDIGVTTQKIINIIEEKQSRKRKTMKYIKANKMMDEMLAKAIGAIEKTNIKPES